MRPTRSPGADRTCYDRKGIDSNGKKIKFLRRIPVDPMTGKDDWGLRSMQDEADSESWGGQNVLRSEGDRFEREEDQVSPANSCRPNDRQRRLGIAFDAR